MEKRLNVLFISSWFPTREKPTNGNFVESHAKASSLYHNVSIIHVSKSKIKRKYEIVKRTSGNIDIQNLYFKQSATGLKIIDNFINHYRHFKYYAKLFSDLPSKPDIVHASVTYPVGLVALFFKYRYRVKFVLTEHWTIYQKENRHRIKGLKKWLFKLVARKASVIMPVSHQLGGMMQEVGLSGNYQVVPNTINSDVFKYHALPKSDVFQFIHISTLAEKAKNPKGMLRAYQRLLATHSNVHFKIISDGDIETSKKYADEIGIPEDKISFVGTQTAQEIAEHLNKAHVFVLFSNFENLPLVIIESFACGLPVITTDVGGIKERFPDGFGVMIKKGDEEALFQAIQTVIEKYLTYDSVAISDYARKTFSYEAVGKTFSDIYKNTLNTSS